MKKVSLRELLKIFVIACLIVGLTACGGGQDTGDSNNDGGQSEPAGSGTDKDPVLPPDKDGQIYASDGQVMTVGGEVRLGLAFDADFYNPFYQGHASGYAWPAMEPLAYFRPYDMSWRPCLATEWERDSETSLLIHLNDKATWSDGTPFTSADVIATWDARFEHGTDSVIGSPIKHEAVDEHTVRIEWQDFSLQYEVWALCQFVYQAKAIEEHDTDWLNTNLVGTGPYVMTSFVPDQELIFEKRDDYWGDPVGPDKISFKYIQDSVAQMASFINGEIDSMSVRDDVTATQLQAEGFEGTENLIQGTNYYALIIRKDPDAPLSNDAVRRALYLHGVDWEAHAAIVGGAIGFHTDMLGIPSMSYYKDTLEQTSYDPEKCKDELAAAGYPDGFTCDIYARASTTIMATALQESLKQVGVTANIVMVDDSLSFGKILADDAYMSGILFGNFTHSVYPQMDRFIKHFGPDVTFGAAGPCSDERRTAWENAFTAKTEEDENKWLYEYVDCYVHKEASIWPTYNTRVLNFEQSWFHHSPYNISVGVECDPHEIWVNEK